MEYSFTLCEYIHVTVIDLIKKTDWLIDGHDKVRWENQTKNTGEEDVVRGVTSQTCRGSRR